MAGALLVDACARRSVSVSVSSAGFLFDGHPASATTVKVMHERGIDLRAHRSRLVTADLIAAADLVLTMERRHARDLIVEFGRADIVHTLKGFATSVSSLLFGDGGNATQADDSVVVDVSTLVHAADHIRPADALLGDARPDEVADPHGRSRRAHRRTADEITAAVEAIAVVLEVAGARAIR